MSFNTPLALFLLLILPLIIWVGRPRHLRHSQGRWRDWVSLGIRLLIVLLLVLSLAGAQAVRAADELAVVFLLDASDSISPEQAAQAETFIRQSMTTMGPNDQAAIVVFGANALVEQPMSNLAELAPITSIPQRLHTNTAEAIRLGLALFPAGSARRLVLLSDGTATLGDTAAAARLAAAGSVPIDFVYLQRPSTGAEVTVTDVRAPSRVDSGETFGIEVSATSSIDTAAELRILSGNNVIHQEQVQLRPGNNNFTVRLRASAPEFSRYRVQLDPLTDTYFQNNELAAFTEITGAPQILLVAGGPDAALPDEMQQLRLALQATGLQVSLTSPEEMPTALSELSNYAGVVLVNINAKNLSARKMAALQSYVRDLGGGLVVVGGPQSYGMGGYFQTPLEETLPVNMQISDQERFPAVSMALVIDRSGSMAAEEGGVTKIQLANEGAARVVQLLHDFDEITVIPVDTVADNPIGPLSAADKETAINLIRQIGAGGGGIYVRTGLETAAQALAQSANEVKHIILLADGADAEQKEGVPELIAGLTAQGVTVSVVSIGRGPDTAWLQQMAELGNGRFHFTDQAANLPQIFTQETTAIQRSYLIEERFFPNLGDPSPILAGIRAVPPLYGYVGTSPKETAQVVLTTQQGDPLLATWQYGLGRAVAWTSDATGRWATDWVRWEGFPAFWAQTVRWTLSEGRDSNVQTAVTFNDEQAVLTVDALGSTGQFLNDLNLEANVVGPSGLVTTLPMHQIAPGRYQAAFAPDDEGAYLLRVAGGSADEPALVGQTSGWVLGYSPEYRDLSTTPQTLQTISRATGGRDLSSLDSDTVGNAVFAHDLPTQSTSRPIWPWLTLLALLLLPLDIAVRRLVITREDTGRAWAASFGRLLPQQTNAPLRTERVSRLFEAKERAGTQAKTPSAAEPPQVQREDAILSEQGKEGADDGQRPLASSTPPPPDQTEGSLASRLLKKRQEKD